MRVAALKAMTAAFAIATSVTSIAVYEVISRPIDDPARRPIQPWSPETVLAESIGLAGARPEAIQHTFGRPVFSPTRRPFAPPPPQAEASPPPPPEPPQQQQAAAPDATGLQLKGILLNSATSKALLIWPESPQGQWLVIGSSVMGWELTKIGEDTVGLSAGSQTLELKLYVDNHPD